MRINPHKTVVATSKGIIISFRDTYKHSFMPYENRGMEDIQVRGHKKFQILEQPEFNKVQQMLYAETVYGLSHFKEEAIQKMSKSKKQRVIAKCAKAQRILNQWKQEIVFDRVDNFFLSLFPKSSITKLLVETKGFDRETRETHTFKELGLTQKDIANKLIEAQLLPRNFFQLA